MKLIGEREMSGSSGYLFPAADVAEVAGETRTSAITLTDMPLRDYFAAAALQGILARGSQAATLAASRPSLAAAAYEYADEMLKARAR
jgi:hypothetical protein